MRSKWFLIPAVLLAVACASRALPEESRAQEAEIFPDYKEVTIPPNIAPLNFTVAGEGPWRLVLEGKGVAFGVKARHGLFRIPAGKWRSLLSASRGEALRLTVCRQENGKWTALTPFRMYVAPDPVDSHIAYRLIAPGYGLWNEMGIYQRDLESYRQKPVYENRLTSYNCVNCHSFQMQDPGRMVFHMRANYGGTVLCDGDRYEKLNTKTPETISALVYPYWHPQEDLIAFSVNKTLQSFHAHDADRIEVYDGASDVVVYDIRSHAVFSDPLLMQKSAFETFPTFSPDGKSLYFCSAPAVDPMPERYKDVHYNLCRIGFDPETKTFTGPVDTLFHAADTASASFPRISPDGRQLVFTKHAFGNFSIWHRDADLYRVDLTDGTVSAMTAANSDNVESYHSWSHDSRWMVFSSRRIDGLYTRLYIMHIDGQGEVSKPFLLPQKDPKRFYESLMFSYNIPEFITGAVTFDRHRIASMMRNEPGTDLSFNK